MIPEPGRTGSGVGFGWISALVAGVSIVGCLLTVALLPEPKGISLEELTETGVPDRRAAVRMARHQQIRAPGA